MTKPVFLFDVDNTLLNNDQLKEDLARELQVMLGEIGAARFWQTYEEVRVLKEYVDFPSTLDRFAALAPDAPISAVRELIMSVPFHAYVYAGALDAIHYADSLGTAVIVSDGDQVFQTLKIERSGLATAVGGRVMLTTHKQQEIGTVFSSYPSDRYVMIDDKTSILADLRKMYPDKIFALLVRQGKYSTIPANPHPNLTVASIGDFVGIPLSTFEPAMRKV